MLRPKDEPVGLPRLMVGFADWNAVLEADSVLALAAPAAATKAIMAMFFIVFLSLILSRIGHTAADTQKA